VPIPIEIARIRKEEHEFGVGKGGNEDRMKTSRQMTSDKSRWVSLFFEL
jgi:hypothetical protein